MDANTQSAIWRFLLRRIDPACAGIRCPDHGRFCVGRRCCCREYHLRPFKFARAMRDVR
jgi:hypothetical protein